MTTLGEGWIHRTSGGIGAKWLVPVVLWIRVVLAGLAFVGFFLGACVYAALILPLARWRHRRAAPLARAAACQRWVQRGFVFFHDYMRWCRLLHFNPRQSDWTLPPDAFKTGVVFVANHPTLVDMTAITAAFGRLTCVAKTQLFQTPFVGGVLRACAHLDGGSGDPFSGGLVVDQALDRLSKAMPVLIFPEGTRSPPDALHPFKRGAFEIACRAGVPLFPVFIRCEPSALGKGRPWYDIPRTMAFLTITPLPMMHPSAFNGDPAAMASACEQTYRRLLCLPHNQPSQTRASQ